MTGFSRFARAAVIAAAVGFAGAASAQTEIGGYSAYIGWEDLHNSKGARLTAPWQVVRQDRANYHRFGISQPGDDWDPFFASMENRAAMERMIMNGTIEPSAAQILMQGGATVFVRIYGQGGVGNSIRVTVSR
ncbi:hypothetical protein [Sinisalibacter lacisalsi]|uniref:Uncharacterized protein n=1 Tax=Sinisalibacter lacisalsi TaxID=1526570 RepID=A0ABQ1QFG2_9RHOB|nr:hypothetical protein [Sinisalibacter lacisalsi]GGD25982.1 hypothetical protein GCM10011358_08030 [Sinisalibacter lacisalsi]